MKKFKFITISLFTFVLTSYVVANEILTQIGFTETYAQDQILKNLIGDFRNQAIDESSYQNDGSVRYQMKSFQIPKVKNLSSIISGDKKAAALQMCAYIKSYCESPQFSIAYQKLREKAKPTGEPYRMSAEEIKNIESSLKEAEKAMKAAGAHLSAPQKAEMNKAIQQQRDQLANMKDPNPNKTHWEKLYPADPKVMIQNSLNEYLALVKAVDFNAKTTGSGNKQKFINPEYESKSLKWKAIYRAGKEVNDDVTAFVKNWIQTGVKTN